MSDLVQLDPAVTGATYIVYDFETGGLSPEKNPPLQLAMLVVSDKLVELDAQCLKIKPVPGYTIEPGAVKVNGYNEADWASAFDLPDAEVYFAKLIKQWFPGTYQPIGIGHNIRRFDVTFLQKFFPMCARMFSPDMLDTLTLFKDWREKHGMVKVANPLTGKMENAKNNLGVLAKYAGYNHDKAHDAKADCRASLAGLKWIISDQPPQGREADEPSE